MSIDNYYTATINAKSRSQDMIRRAENERLASIARQHRSHTAAFRPLLDTIGNSLVRLGLDLKERAGTVAELEPTPVQRTRIAG